MVTRSDINQKTKALNQLSKNSNTLLAKLENTLDWTNPSATYKTYQSVYSQLLARILPITQRVTIGWYNQIRIAETGQALTPNQLETLTQTDILNLAKTATSYAFQNSNTLTSSQLKTQTKTRLRQYTSLQTANHSRRVVCNLIDTDPEKPRWARVPSGSFTCAWCAMLASRGWIYHSPQTAGQITGSYHTDCDCQIIPNWDKKKAKIEGYDPDQLYTEYKAARGIVVKELEKLGIDAYPTDKDIAYRMRRLFPHLYKDGVFPKKPGQSPSMPGASKYAPWDCANVAYKQGLSREKFHLLLRQQNIACFQIDFSDLVQPSGKVDILDSRELDFLERFKKRGESVRWIAKDESEAHKSTNDFVWVSGGNEVFELKCTKDKYAPIKEHIKDSVLKARKNHGVVKDRFVIDLGNKRLNVKVRHHLEQYNQRVEEAQIKRLIVLHSDGEKLEEIVLK